MEQRNGRGGGSVGGSMDRRRHAERRYSYGYGGEGEPPVARPGTGSLERSGKHYTEYPSNIPDYGGYIRGRIPLDAEMRRYSQPPPGAAPPIYHPQPGASPPQYHPPPPGEFAIDFCIKRS